MSEFSMGGEYRDHETYPHDWCDIEIKLLNFVTTVICLPRYLWSKKMKIFGILFFVLLAWLFFKSNTKRGINFVRSFYFLAMLEEGKTVEEANYMARQIATKTSDPNLDHKVFSMAELASKEYFGGKQLPIIAEAKRKGFVQ